MADSAATTSALACQAWVITISTPGTSRRVQGRIRPRAATTRESARPSGSARLACIRWSFPQESRPFVTSMSMTVPRMRTRSSRAAVLSSSMTARWQSGQATSSPSPRSPTATFVPVTAGLSSSRSALHRRWGREAAQRRTGSYDQGPIAFKTSTTGTCAATLLTARSLDQESPMSRIRFGAATFAITAVLAGAPLAMAAGGGPGGGAPGGGGPGGGGGGTCMPVVMPLTLVHPRTQYSLNLTATIKNCSALGAVYSNGPTRSTAVHRRLQRARPARCHRELHRRAHPDRHQPRGHRNRHLVRGDPDHPAHPCSAGAPR